MSKVCGGTNGVMRTGGGGKELLIKTILVLVGGSILHIGGIKSGSDLFT